MLYEVFLRDSDLVPDRVLFEYLKFIPLFIALYDFKIADFSRRLTHSSSSININSSLQSQAFLESISTAPSVFPIEQSQQKGSPLPLDRENPYEMSIMRVDRPVQG